MSRDDQTSRLMPLWGFDQADLDANRKGQLSARQQARIEEGRKLMAKYTASNPRLMLIIFIVILALGGGMMFLLFRQSGQSGASLPISPAAIMVLGGAVVLIPVVLMLSARRTSNQVAEVANAAIDVLNVSGPVKYVSGGGSKYGYWKGIEVEGVKFTNGTGGVFSTSNADEQQLAFTEGASYRIFYSKVPVYGSTTQLQFWSAEAV